MPNRIHWAIKGKDVCPKNMSSPVYAKMVVLDFTHKFLLFMKIMQFEGDEAIDYVALLNTLNPWTQCWMNQFC
jgi:hypothetical protein